jgi:TPR repeat protein
VAKNQAAADRWYSIAASELDVFAQKGDAGSQNRLAGLYEHGKGVKVNMASAVNWYRKAALQGMAEAQFNLGRLLAYGDIERNLDEAVYWLQRAVKSGHEEASLLLAKVTEAAQSEEVAFFDRQYD